MSAVSRLAISSATLLGVNRFLFLGSRMHRNKYPTGVLLPVIQTVPAGAKEPAPSALGTCARRSACSFFCCCRPMLNRRLAGHTVYPALSLLIGLAAASRSANSVAGPRTVSLSSDRKFVHTSSGGKNSILECSRMFAIERSR